jgi:hypothetical protein
MKSNSLELSTLSNQSDNLNFFSNNYTDPTRNKEEKLFLEKRRRNQSYITLDYMLSVISYFDFFSTDTFKIVLNSKYIAQICHKKIVTSEFLLLPFLNSNSPIVKLLENYKLTNKVVSIAISSFNNFSEKEVKKQNSFSFKKLFFKENNSEKLANIKYSHEINLLFEKAAENALTRFKTPVITTEILFITMMEEKNTRVGKIIKKLLKTDSNWYILRYKLLKYLHSQELIFRNDIIKNQQYFGYLLKTQLSDLELEKMIADKSLNERVAIFRSKLIQNILKEDLIDILIKDINKSIKYTNKRNYSI